MGWGLGYFGLDYVTATTVINKMLNDTSVSFACSYEKLAKIKG